MKARRFLSLLVCAALVLTLLPVTARAATNVPYIDENGDPQTASSAEEITIATTGLADGWYLATGTVTCNATITVTGNVHLILADGATLTANGDNEQAGIQVSAANSLTIYRQENGTGALITTGGVNGAGIGGGAGFGNVGTVTINGGTVTATGGCFGAGIGGGFDGHGGTVIINGGTVTAKGDGLGAGIGGGSGGNGGTVTINGGIVTANGGMDGAGIGGGIGGSGGTVTINGGMVTATGGSRGAGIGGGGSGGGGTVTISGGTVTATGDSRGAGIGGGNNGGGGTVTIKGGTVSATGSDGGAGIGGGRNADGNMGAPGTCVITGGSVNTGSMGPAPTNGTNNVYLTTLTLPGINTPTSIPKTALGFGSVAAGYGRNGLVTDEDGVLYFYLPVGDAVAAHGGAAYAETVEAAHTNAFALAAGRAYVVNYDFSHLTPEAPTSFVAGGGSFSVNFTSDPGFGFPNEVKVTMGGSSLAASDDYTYGVTGTAYGRIIIPNVSGDILIEAAGAALSTDAALSYLSLSDGALSPDFANAVYEYTAAVGNAVSSLTVHFDRSNGSARVKVNGEAASYVFHSDPIALAVGANTILVEVTAQDGTTTKTYTVTVTRAAAVGDTGPSYIPRTLTDSATGVTLTGESIHELARLTVSPLALHPNDPACDAIRKAQKEGQVILGFDIGLSRGFIAPLTISIPVGSQYSGKNVTILHCVNGRLETITATVVNGMATFTVKELSPFAVTTGIPVQITGVPNTGGAASPWGFLLIGLAAACAGYMVVKRRRA